MAASAECTHRGASQMSKTKGESLVNRWINIEYGE